MTSHFLPEKEQQQAVRGKWEVNKIILGSNDGGRDEDNGRGDSEM